ncbi:MAG: phage tail protein [Dehalococcoidia bacterium]
MTTPTAVATQGPPGGGSQNGVAMYGRGPFGPAPIGVPEARSSYLGHLPGIYQESDFLGRFLLIFEHILSPIDQTVGALAEYFDASLTPTEFLPWLGSWIGLVVDVRVPEENRREMVRAAPELFRWRGTKRGLREFLRLSTGIEPEIIEPTLSEIASNPNRAYRFTVRVPVPAGQTPPARAYLETIIEAEKPAFAGYNLEIVNA